MIVALLALAAIVAVLAAVTGVDVDWTTWAPATCMPDKCFCEHVGHGFVRQPANTWSNMGFVLVGLLIIAKPLPATSVRAPLRDDRAYRVAFGAMAASVGLGSWLYHASMTFVGQWFDVMAMYLLPTFLIAYNFVRLGKLKTGGFLGAWLAINAALGWMLVAAPAARRPVFGALIGLLIVSEIVTTRVRPERLDKRLMAAAAGALGMAFLIWNLDLRGIVCAPHSLVQGHAFWHLLCALSTWLLYRYYASAEARDGDELPAAP